MNPDPDKLRALLDDVLPAASEHCGPSSDEVLSILRRERQRRRRLQNSVAVLATVAVAGGAWLWNNKPEVEVPVVQMPSKPAPIVIHRVNDEELFALLKGTPVALMEQPDGRRTLLVIEQPVSQ